MTRRSRMRWRWRYSRKHRKRKRRPRSQRRSQRRRRKPRRSSRRNRRLPSRSPSPRRKPRRSARRNRSLPSRSPRRGAANARSPRRSCRSFKARAIFDAFALRFDAILRDFRWGFCPSGLCTKLFGGWGRFFCEGRSSQRSTTRSRSLPSTIWLHDFVCSVLYAVANRVGATSIGHGN